MDHYVIKRQTNDFSWFTPNIDIYFKETENTFKQLQTREESESKEGLFTKNSFRGSTTVFPLHSASFNKICQQCTTGANRRNGHSYVLKKCFVADMISYLCFIVNRATGQFLKNKQFTYNIIAWGVGVEGK